MLNLKDPVVELLSQCVKGSTMTEAEARSILLLPLVEVPELNPDIPTQWSEFLELPAQQEYRDAIITRDEFLLLQASYWIPRFGLYVFKINAMDKEDPYAPIVIDADFVFDHNVRRDKRARLKGCITLDQYNPNDIKLDDLFVYISDKRMRVTADHFEKHQESFMQIMHGLRILSYFTKFQAELDKYPVEVKRAKPSTLMRSKNTVDKRLAQAIVHTPRIIYLNTLPSTKTVADHANEGEVAARKMHQRRGHWKTLRDERYAKHPKYMIENAIRVRPAFVGELQTEYNGNVYRVLLPNEYT